MKGSADIEVDVTTHEMTGVQAKNALAETTPLNFED